MSDPRRPAILRSRSTRPPGHRAVELGGSRLAVTSHGSGPPVVLVHGLGASSRWWKRNLGDLTRHFAVHLVDLQGVAWRPRHPFVLADSARLLARAIEDLDAGAVDIVGHSMGGLIAAELAADRPDLVRRLVLVDSAGMPFEGPFARHAMRLIRGAPTMPLSLYPTVIRDAIRGGLMGVTRAGHQVVASDLEARLSGIRAPTLVVWGARDSLIGAGTGERLARAIPGARFVLIPKASHNVMWEAPHEFDTIVISFLRDPSLPSPAATDGEPSPRSSPGGVPRAAPIRRRALVSRYVLVDGLPVHVRVGLPPVPAAGPPVVLVHGFVISSRYMVPTAVRLARRHRVYAPDMPGFGWSGHPREVLDMPGLADAVVRTLDALQIERAILLGNSLGCQVIAHAAARHPERVAGVVLVGPTIDPTDRRLPAQILKLLIDAPRERWRLWLLHLVDYILAGPRRILGTAWHLWRDRIERVLPRVDVPALVVHGTRDPLVTPRWVRLATALLPQGRRLELEGAPHAANYSTPDQLAGAVEPFLAEVAALEERRAEEPEVASEAREFRSEEPEVVMPR
jgi:2-hydroxy-6-oxonona-2,4-dienedioate hydrolase